MRNCIQNYFWCMKDRRKGRNTCVKERHRSQDVAVRKEASTMDIRVSYKCVLQ